MFACASQPPAPAPPFGVNFLVSPEQTYQLRVKRDGDAHLSEVTTIKYTDWQWHLGPSP